MLETLTQLGRETVRIVLHAPCVVCERELPWSDRVASCCRDCWDSLPRINGAKCESCAAPLSGRGRCIACLDDALPVDWTEAWGHYRGPLERVLHAFKFERADFLDAPLARLVGEVIRDEEFDAVTAVPMHRSKLRTRGYNQAELLGRAIAKRMGIPYEPLLAKTAERASQSTLPRSERAANVRSVFTSSKAARGRSVLLIDDICTTGETLRACAAALQKGKAKRVCAAVVAKA